MNNTRIPDTKDAIPKVCEREKINPRTQMIVAITKKVPVFFLPKENKSIPGNDASKYKIMNL